MKFVSLIQGSLVKTILLSLVEMVKIHIKLELIFVFTYQLDSDYTTRIVEMNDSICIGHLWAMDHVEDESEYEYEL